MLIGLTALPDSLQLDHEGEGRKEKKGKNWDIKRKISKLVLYSSSRNKDLLIIVRIQKMDMERIRSTVLRRGCKDAASLLTNDLL